MAFKVIGGVYSDFSKKDLVTPEMHGPFPTYEEAKVVWQTSIWKNVDNALHMLEIIEVDDQPESVTLGQIQERDTQ